MSATTQNQVFAKTGLTIEEEKYVQAMDRIEEQQGKERIERANKAQRNIALGLAVLIAGLWILTRKKRR